MRLTLLNRFLPPAPGVTGRLLYRLAQALSDRLPGLECQAVGTDLAYGNHPAAEVPAMSAQRFPSWQGYGRIWRLPATLHDGWRMARYAAAVGDDVVLSCTDPPMLGWWLSHTLPVSRRWVEWTMDLYPDALAAAVGLPCPRLSLGRLFHGRLPDLRLCLGPAQAHYLTGRDGRPCPHLILPAGITARAKPKAVFAADGRVTLDRVTLVYAGNLGLAHAPEALAALAAALDPVRFRLRLAVQGRGGERLRRRLSDFPAVDWSDRPLSEADLDAADVHIASLKPGWTHLCVPSKAVSALCRGRPLLFFGSELSDVWQWAQPERNGGKAAGIPGGWRVDLDNAGRPDRAMLAVALREMLQSRGLAAATLAAEAAGDRLRDIAAAGIDGLAAWLMAPNRDRDAAINLPGIPTAGQSRRRP